MTQPTSMVMARIGGNEYPMRSDPNCLVCQSPHRLFIEAELLRARSYRAISRAVANLPAGPKNHPDHQSISNHVTKQHMPLGNATMRRIVERRAIELSDAIEGDDNDPLADYVTVNQMIVQRGVEMVASGQIEIKAGDIVAASRFLHQVENAAGEAVDQTVWVEAMMEHMEIAQRVMPPAVWEKYTAALHKSPVLKALAEKRAQHVIGELEAG